MDVFRQRFIVEDINKLPVFMKAATIQKAWK